MGEKDIYIEKLSQQLEQWKAEISDLENHAEDAGGLSVKGTSLDNFNESKSVHKKLRKPEVNLPEVMKAGKVLLRNYMDNIRAVESSLTGRLNADTILLRSLK